MKKAFEKIEKSLKILLTYVGRCDNIIKSRATRTRQAAVAQAVERRIGSKIIYDWQRQFEVIFLLQALQTASLMCYD